MLFFFLFPWARIRSFSRVSPPLRCSLPADGERSTPRLRCGVAALAGYTSKGNERGRCSAREPETYQMLRLDEIEFHASPATRWEHEGRSGVWWQDLANAGVQGARGAPRSSPHTSAGSALIQLPSKS